MISTNLDVIWEMSVKNTALNAEESLGRSIKTLGSVRYNQGEVEKP